MIRLLRTSALALILAATGSAYYHFVHYAAGGGSFAPIPERFDLAALPNKTVNFYVSTSGPTQYAPGDSFEALLGQLRFAGRAWSSVATSDLRVRFGGLFTPGVVQNRPHIEVVFEELPPGVLAYGGPIVRADVAAGSPGQFVPIQTAVMALDRDMATWNDGVLLSSQRYAMVLVHEMGHALGLQHTLTSSAMSQKDTRAATKGKPLGADDVAGVSLLYPNATFAASLGVVSGKVTMGGVGVHMASVVAIAPTGEAVSSLANPDGSYRIEGVPPGQYHVYAHTLPPDADIVPARDSDGASIPAGGAFRTQFYPGVSDPGQATLLSVAAGGAIPDVNFDVLAGDAPSLYGISTFSYFGQRSTYNAALDSAFVNVNGPSKLLVAEGPGLMPGGQLAPGLSVLVLGNLARVNSVERYTDYYLTARFGFNLFTHYGPRHLVFSTGDTVYVRPSGLNLVETAPPTILTVVPGTNESARTLTIQGENFGADTQILVDGLKAEISSFDPATGTIVAAGPALTPGYRASVVAVNAEDGQTSEFAQDPMTYTSGEAFAAMIPSVSFSTSALPAGAEALIDVYGINTNFQAGETQLGFGSSDITVKRALALAPDHLQAVVAVSPAAPAGSVLITIVTGLQVITPSVQFTIDPANPFQLSADSTLVNPETGLAYVYPGSLAAIAVSNLPVDAIPSITLGDAVVEIVSVTGNRIVFRVPSATVPGTAILKVQAGGRSAYPVLVSIDKAPPTVLTVWHLSHPVDASVPARPGELLTTYVSGLDPGVEHDTTRLRVMVGGVEHSVFFCQAVADPPGAHQVEFRLDPGTPEGSLPLTIAIDGRTSAAFTLVVKNE